MTSVTRVSERASDNGEFERERKSRRTVGRQIENCNKVTLQSVHNENLVKAQQFVFGEVPKIGPVCVNEPDGEISRGDATIFRRGNTCGQLFRL
jgi:hypothetical protein